MPTIRPTPRTRTTLAAAAVVALLLAACGGGEDSEPAGGASEPAGDAMTVELSGFAFAPGEITVAAGTTVTFVNRDGAPHTVTHGMDGEAVDASVVDEQLPAGEEITFTFDTPGTYPITCTIHPTMNMTVVVEG